MHPNKLQSKVAMVTGASRGIGRAVAEELARAGAALAINYVADESAAREVVDTIIDAGGRARAFQADISEADQVEKLFDAILDDFGQLDILVNNAGLACYAPIQDYRIEEFDRLMAVNVRGPFLACRQAARKMADNGAIINITSTVTRVMLPRYGVYAATKGAIDVLSITRCMERIGDLATNIAEDVIFLVEGSIVRHSK